VTCPWFLSYIIFKRIFLEFSFQKNLLSWSICSAEQLMTANINCSMSQDGEVGTATGYGPYGKGVWVPAGRWVFSSPCLPDWFQGYWASFSGGKAVGAWSWPFTSKPLTGWFNILVCEASGANLDATNSFYLLANTLFKVMSPVNGVRINNWIYWTLTACNYR
jgi:hypothetical protein